MNRREFMTTSGAALLGTTWGTKHIFGQATRASTDSGIAWHRHDGTNLFDQVSVNGRPLVNLEEKVGLLDGFCQMMRMGEFDREVIFGCDQPSGRSGPIQVELTHRLLRPLGPKQDILEATLSLRNVSDTPWEMIVGFLNGARPAGDVNGQQIHVALSAAGLGDPDNAPNSRMKECRQTIGKDGFVCHYLEVSASDPKHSTTCAPILVPVVDLSSANGPCRVGMIGTSTEPMFLEALQGVSSRAWRMGRRVHLLPGASHDIKAYLLLHAGDVTEAWDVFHAYGHKDEYSPIEWTHDVRVHYYDFLSGVAADGPRGGGYDLDVKHFEEFHVGLGTQHGYYLAYGDFVHPDRKEWPAMSSDPAGSVTMSIEKIRARVEATRKAGAHPAIYMHFTLLDEGSPLFEVMKDSVLIGATGKPAEFGWSGPDTIKKSWHMSTNSAEWQDHLVQQAHWIMELFKPDAIVLDETFSSLGYDFRKQTRGPTSRGGIELMRKLRTAVRSFGQDKALFSSDCSMSSFCLWGDGEAGDHCYDRLLAQEQYRKQPVRYMSALDKKAWLPCAWLYKSLWPVQVDLARKTGAAVSVTDGWGDGFGLTRLPEESKKQMLRDIEALAKEHNSTKG